MKNLVIIVSVWNSFGDFFNFRKEQKMNATATLERPEIEDALFGQGQVTTMEEEAGPDNMCFCICACKDSSTRTTNSRLDSAGLSIGKPMS